MAGTGNPTKRSRVRRIVASIPGARWLWRRLLRYWRSRRSGDGGNKDVPFTRPIDRGACPKLNLAAIAQNYRSEVASREPETFVLYRIIGNDLPPRHELGQSLRNLEFILEHEPELPGCDKRFVINRIVDQGQEQAVMQLLEEVGAKYLHIPFDLAEYATTPWDIEGVSPEYAPWAQTFSELEEIYQGRSLMRLYRFKNNYVMNNNGARNAALRDGRRVAKWVLPWDGNCFVTAAAWEEIVSAVRQSPWLRYFIVPMARITENARLLDPGFRPEADEEPQVLFRRDTPLQFNPDYYYGRRPKVELFWRLGVPGKWDTWPLEPWDLPCPPYVDEVGAFEYAGWVARLFSGRVDLEDNRTEGILRGERNVAFHERGLARVEAIKEMLDLLDDAAHPIDAKRLAVLSGANPQSAQRAPLSQDLLNAAEQALSRGPYSVIDKTTLPPSKNRHDYWHPAPYYWPHPLRLPGLPYVRRDGQRLPGTQLYEPLSERYDRTRLQRLFDDTLVLALAWQLHGGDRYAEHAAALVRTWFLNAETAMNPHLDYAQVRRGHDGNKGNRSGIIEMKDLYYFLDAVRILQAGEWLSKKETDALQSWFGRYLHWLRTSPQGRAERTASNNHGTYYDLQVTSIAGFLGESRLLRETLRDSRSRLMAQLDPAGLQVEEMQRTMTAHYCCFNLQGWIHLAQVAASNGEDLWSFETSDGRGIRQAIAWLLPYIGNDWPYPQIDTFDSDRFLPIYHAYRAAYGEPPGIDPAILPAPRNVKPMFFPHDGIMPFWQLGSSISAAE